MTQGTLQSTQDLPVPSKLPSFQSIWVKIPGGQLDVSMDLLTQQFSHTEMSTESGQNVVWSWSLTDVVHNRRLFMPNMFSPSGNTQFGLGMGCYDPGHKGCCWSPSLDLSECVCTTGEFELKWKQAESLDGSPWGVCSLWTGPERWQQPS